MGRSTVVCGWGGVLLCLLLLVLLAAPPVAAATIQTRITSILGTYHLAGYGTGVRVYDLDAGRAVYARHLTARLRPASNMKLITSATALAGWGADHAFKTELYVPAAGPDANGILHGNVYLKGYGDPSLSTPWFQRNVLHITTSSVTDFVTALQALGVTKVAGHVVGDDSYFDTQRSVANWRPGMTEWCGPLSALSLNEGYSKGSRVANPPLFVARTVTRLLEEAGIDVVLAAGGAPGAQHRDPRLHGVLGTARRHRGGHEQAERQLLRRGADQGAGQGVRPRRDHGRRHRGRERLPALARRADVGLPSQGRVGPELRGPADGPHGQPPAAQGGGQRVVPRTTSARCR